MTRLSEIELGRKLSSFNFWREHISRIYVERPKDVETEHAVCEDFIELLTALRESYAENDKLKKENEEYKAHIPTEHFFPRPYDHILRDMILHLKTDPTTSYVPAGQANAMELCLAERDDWHGRYLALKSRLDRIQEAVKPPYQKGTYHSYHGMVHAVRDILDEVDQ